MRNNLSLNLLYTFHEQSGLYEIIQFFSEAGPVHAKTLRGEYQSFTQEPGESGEILVFKTLDDLGQFALNICKDVQAPEVFILSVHDYNIGLDSCNDVRGFKEIFRRYGASIENPDISAKKKNVFTKIFT